MNSGFIPEEKPRFISSLGTQTNYAFHLGEKLILMDFDGYFLFVKNHQDGSFRYNGSTRLMSALIAQTCPHSVFVRVREPVARALSVYDKKPFLHELKNELAKLEPGPYELKFSNDKVTFEALACAVSPHLTRALRKPEKKKNGPEPL